MKRGSRAGDGMMAYNYGHTKWFLQTLINHPQTCTIEPTHDARWTLAVLDTQNANGEGHATGNNGSPEWRLWIKLADVDDAQLRVHRVPVSGRSSLILHVCMFI
jgi:hypothetical protein